MVDKTLIQVAVPGPFLSGLDYLLPADLGQPSVGSRVWVPLGKRKMVGVVLDMRQESQVENEKLKMIEGIIDSDPLFSPILLKLLKWLAQYYHSSIGDVMHTAMPSLLCQGDAFISAVHSRWRLNPEIRIDLPKLGSKQQAAIALLTTQLFGLDNEMLRQADIGSAVLKSLRAKGLITEIIEPIMPPRALSVRQALQLNAVQQIALNACVNSLDQFSVKLLEGVTGSGKTEVYLQIIAKVLAMGKQALVLVPEIGLTPQMVERFQERFLEPIVLLHSGLTESEKLQHWHWAAHEKARIIIGTRSAVFIPSKNLGVIIIDEEHDLSFKQQSGVRYHARDVAIIRAQMENIPVILGSATPALESIQNAKLGKYQHLVLPVRAGIANKPHFHLIDMRQQPLQGGLSRPFVAAIKRHIDEGGQALIFLNRRGYAPVLMCHACGWAAACQHCDAYLTLHQRPLHLSCHHCGASRPVYHTCQSCTEQNSLIEVGVGTEKIEEILQQLLPKARILRIDRSNVRRKGELQKILEQAHDHHADVLIGTQMLAKGHHFENVTMVGVVNIDGGLFSSDFRALEHTGQLLLQVAGRAGRVARQGEVFIQTHHPEHPLLLKLLEEGYSQFADALLAERQEANLPPFSHLALLKAEGKNDQIVQQFLMNIRQVVMAWQLPNFRILGPAPAFLHRRNGYYQWHILLGAKERKQLQISLNALINYLSMQASHKIRWYLDVDPVEMS